MRGRFAAIAVGLMWMLPAEAMAGMPFVTLTDVARWRLRSMSFFALVGLLVAFGIQRIWNSVRTDFPSMPQLVYTRALGLVVLWGLLFHLVLSMISGARELITPGAWEKSGVLYGLRDSVPATKDERLALARRERLEQLRVALWKWAEDHGGAFPPHEFVGGIPRETWETLDPSKLRYVYVPGRKPEESGPLAYEPGIFGKERFVLYANGEIRTARSAEIAAALGLRE